MATIKFDESLNIKTLNKYFKKNIKGADYSKDITVSFTKDSSVDLAGLQILVAMKKELEKNGKKLKVDGLSDTLKSYLN